jgi:hypothetical protein
VIVSDIIVVGNGCLRFPCSSKLQVRSTYSITLLYEFLFILFIASQGTSLILEGRHNADIGWILELRRSGNALV